MQLADLKNKRIFFCGIGGIGMSGLAKILLEKGFLVGGSDMAESEITTKLRKGGGSIFIGQAKENLADFEVFVYSAAVKVDNPEMKEAQKRKMLILRRSEMLGILMSEKKGIAIAGTHGKTTVTTMLSSIFIEANKNPSFAIGGEVRNIESNAQNGSGELFIAEACEYQKAFLDIYPFGLLLTNIEEDHLDCYKDLGEIIDTFKRLVNQVEKSGFIIFCGDDPVSNDVTQGFSGHLISFGFGEGVRYQARDIKVKDGKSCFKLYKEGKFVDEFSLLIPGNHNILNALAVIACADHFYIPFHYIKKSLNSFRGARRRYEIKGEKGGVLVIDDYAHHPTEIQSTLKGLKEFFPKKKIWCVFQPHQYSRTSQLLADFSVSFSDAFKVIIPDIYAARDTAADIKKVNSQILAKKVNENSKNAIYLGEFQEALSYLKEKVRKDDLIVTMGAGPVYKIGEDFLRVN